VRVIKVRPPRTLLRLCLQRRTKARALQAYAWEDPLMDEVRAGRKQETRMIRRHAYWITLGLSLVFLQLPNVLQVVVLWVIRAGLGAGD
jgi:hypothetical protein